MKLSAKRTANAVNSSISEASCLNCVMLICRAHLTRRRDEKTLSPLLARRAALLETGKSWLGKWKAAEARLKRAKSRYTVACKAAAEGPSYADGREYEERRLADQERGRAIADVERKRNSFANCMRWMLEGK